MHGRSRVPLRALHARAGPLLVAPGRGRGPRWMWSSARSVGGDHDLGFASAGRGARSGDVADELLDVVVQEVGEVVRCDEASVLRRDVGGRGVN